MVTPIPFQPDRFRSTAAHYLAGRPPYAPRLIARVAELCGLDRSQRVMDLGCGPGQLALAFAPFAASVLAIDPEPEMLAVARQETASRASNISFLQASSYDLAPELGRFRVVAIGRAFHWMDRAQTLRLLDAMIEPGGNIAVFDGSHPNVPDNAWLGAFRAVVERYAAEDVERTMRKSGDWVRHEAVLLDSAFAELEEISVIERRQTPVEHLVARAFSMSSLSRQRLGTRAESLEREIRSAAVRWAPGGTVTEVVTTHALLARRG